MIFEYGQKYISDRNGIRHLWLCHGRGERDGRFIMEYLGRSTNSIHYYPMASLIANYGTFTPCTPNQEPLSG